MTWKGFYATTHLGTHLVLRLLKRLFFIKSAGLKEFLGFYREDRIPPLTSEEKDLLFEVQRCVVCGLCDSLCPASKTTPREEFLGPSFLPHLCRSIPDFVGVLPPHVKMCEGDPQCETICPQRVPIKKILEFMAEKEKAVKG